jgi:hypothetical protein
MMRTADTRTPIDWWMKSLGSAVAKAVVLLALTVVAPYARPQVTQTSQKQPDPNAPSLVFVSLTENGFASPEIRAKKGNIRFVIVNASPSLNVELELRRYEGSLLRANPEAQKMTAVHARYKSAGTLNLAPGKYQVRARGLENWTFDLIVEAATNEK